MPRRKPTSEQLGQQSLIGFLQPHSSSSRNDRSKTKLGRASRATETIKQSDTDSDVEAIHFEPRKVVPSDDDDIQPSSPAKRRRMAAEVVPHADHGTSTPSDSDDSIDTNQKASPSTKIGRPVSRSPSTELESPPKRRRLAKGIRPSSPEEPDDLLDEVDEADIIQSRFRNRQKRTAFQQNLDRLKKKKRGVKLPESSDEQTDEDDERIAPFHDSQQDDSNQDGDDDGSDDDDHIDDFVVQDDGAAVPELPMAFSRRGHQDINHDFKVVCQLFVHLAMMPMDERRLFMEEMLEGEHYFSVPFQVIRRKISGTRDSIASSVWRSEYREALERYPDLTLTKLDFAVPRCDACHLGGRLSTVSGWLKGIPYDNLSFEPIIDENDSEDPEDENSHVTSFDLGRFCAARTQIFHQLSHWNYHLYRTLSEEVDLIRQRGKKRAFSRLAYAKNLPPPEDTSNPDDIMEWLDQRGVVSAEWQKIRELLERASSLDASTGRKEEDIDLDM
ncbi:hypothetical protein BJV78DRAFT_1167155 [Lactifluus subvellereus]|nr:hypothetical protein BJV78DRAFT_1167155 [Lactifluus subvellereus]